MMKRSNLIGLALSGVLMASALAFFFASGVGAQSSAAAPPRAPSAPVTVVNTPLPVSGTVAIDATNPIPVRDVDAAVQQPFRATITVFMNTLNKQAMVTTVPAGKRLVVEQISWGGFLATGQQFAFAALRSGELGPVVERLQINPPHASLTPALILQDGAQSTRLYFDAGEQVFVALASTATSAQFDLYLSGYLIDM